MKQIEIEQLRAVRAFLKTQLERNERRSLSELTRSLGLKAAFGHYSAERLWAMINEAVAVYNEDFQTNRATGTVTRREPPWWSVWRCPPITASGMTGEAMERKEA